MITGWFGSPFSSEIYMSKACSEMCMSDATQHHLTSSTQMLLSPGTQLIFTSLS